jgi:hypothetical protein
LIGLGVVTHIDLSCGGLRPVALALVEPVVLGGVMSCFLVARCAGSRAIGVMWRPAECLTPFTVDGSPWGIAVFQVAGTSGTSRQWPRRGVDD